jgi:hypothetical protein
VFARPRLLAEVRFALAGALLGGAAGLALSLLLLPPGRADFTTAPPGARWLLAVAPGFGFGWWGGMLWSVMLALDGRRRRPPSPTTALLPAAAAAAVVVVLAGAGARLAAVDLRWGILAGLAGGTFVARAMLARAGRRVEP